MNKRSETVVPLTEHKAITTPELCEMLSCGRKNAERIGQAANSRIQIGRSVRWNVKKITEYLDKIAE